MHRIKFPHPLRLVRERITKVDVQREEVGEDLVVEEVEDPRDIKVENQAWEGGEDLVEEEDASRMIVSRKRN
jgi:hypothetical protein